MRTNFIQHAGILLAVGLLQAASAQASTVVWNFNLPATAVASQNPPYPSVATLTLQDTPVGVRFTLDPNEAHPGFDATSHISALNITYAGAADLPSSVYESILGPAANTDGFGSKNNPLIAVVPGNPSTSNMDSSYKSAAGQLLLTWSPLNNFTVDRTHVWAIAGTTIEDNFSALANSNSNPSPVFGIISISPVSAFPGGPTPTPSNWVTSMTPVPVPAAFWLFGSCLLGFVRFVRTK